MHYQLQMKVTGPEMSIPGKGYLGHSSEVTKSNAVFTYCQTSLHQNLYMGYSKSNLHLF
jgi:hypothetical protein